MNVYEMYIEMNKRVANNEDMRDKRFKHVQCTDRFTGKIYKNINALPVELAESPEYFVMFKPEAKYLEVLK